MSTKTTFKRVALVAVAALGFGTLSVAPSSAVQLVSVTTATAASTGTTAVAARAVVSLNGYCDSTGEYAVTNYISVWAELPAASRVGLPAHGALTSAESTAYSSATTNYGPTNTSLAFSGQYQSVGKQWIPGNGGTSVTQANSSYVYCNTVGRYAQLAAISFTPDVAGTYKIMTFDPANASSTQNFWTITVTAPVVQSIKAYLNTDTTTATSADATSLTYAAASSVTAKGAVVVQQYSTTDTTTVATTAISQAVTVAISKGLVSKTNDYFAGAKSVTTAAGATAGRSEYYVFANGEVGSATLTVTVGALTSTKTITFNGVAASMTAALTTGQNTWIAPNGTATLTVGSKDSAGSASTNTPTITATSATTTVATVVATSNTLVTITGVAAGTSVITIADSAGTATSATYTVTVAPAASVTLPTLTFDKAEYAAGELMTITIGAAAADNASFAAFTAAPATSLNIVTVKNPFTNGSVALVSGKATWTAYAPITAGPITVTATSSTGSAATAAEVKATAVVVSDGVAQAAVDAAAEAIDAANAATDAANAAAEAADAATAAAQDAADAVAALSVAVTAQIDALKAQNDALRKQLIALTNLIIKIQKKVKA